PIFQQVHIRDRVAQTVVSESAFNDATGAIVTFAVLTVATGAGQFSLAASLLDLLKQLIVGIVAGAALGYLAALLIAHERWAFLKEYAPIVTVMAVIGAYFAADGLQASGFTAVFVFGIVLGNQSSFGFKMGAGEAQRLEEYVSTTSFIMRLFIFILLGTQVDFTLMSHYLVGGIIVVAIFMLVARPATVFLDKSLLRCFRHPRARHQTLKVDSSTAPIPSVSDREGDRAADGNRPQAQPPWSPRRHDDPGRLSAWPAGLGAVRPAMAS